jgi:hypothetical protein
MCNIYTALKDEGMCVKIMLQFLFRYVKGNVSTIKAPDDVLLSYLISGFIYYSKILSRK